MKPENKDYSNYLYEKYYLNREEIDTNVSSHWKDYSSKFSVKYDNENKLSLEGFGFGDLQDNFLPNRWLARLCEMSYLFRDRDRKNKKELIETGRLLSSELDGYFSFDCFRQVYSLDLIQKHIYSHNIGENLTIMIIGDGFGYLSFLIKKTIPSARIVMIDLGKTLFFQNYFANKIFPSADFYGIKSADEKVSNSVLKKNDILFCPSDCIDALTELEIDVAVNIHSMQEMTYQSISQYFGLLRTVMAVNNLFYCCNRERKELVGGEVIEFDNYPWDENDRILLDEYCPWCRYFFSTARPKNGLKLAGIRIPFINYFDGPIRHRLTVLRKK